MGSKQGNNEHINNAVVQLQQQIQQLLYRFCQSFMLHGVKLIKTLTETGTSSPRDSKCLPYPTPVTLVHVSSPTLSLRLRRLGCYMSLYIRRIYLTDEGFPWVVAHLNAPYPHLCKLVIMFMIMILLPHAFNQGKLDAHIARNLLEAAITLLSLLRPRSFRRRLRKLRNVLWQRKSLLALTSFAVKSYVVYKGVTIQSKAIMYNKPVIHRFTASPDHSKCESLNSSSARAFLMWEVEHCSKSWEKDGYITTSYVPSIKSVDGSEQQCLPRARSQHLGTGQVDSHPDPGPGPAYDHPIAVIKNGCKQAGVSCDFLRNASSQNGTTWITLDSPRQRVALRFGGKHRPAPSVIREVALAVRAGGNRVNYTGTGLAVSQAIRHSACFARNSIVDTVKVPHLVLHLLPLVLLWVMESLFRKSFEKYGNDNDEERTYDEYISMALEELCK